MKVRQKHIITLFTSACMLLLLHACNLTSPVQSGSYKMLYDFQSSVIHPDYVLYHFSNDSSTIYFRIKSSELLYSRATSEAPFQAKIKLKFSIYTEAGVLKDSVSHVITDFARKTPGWLLGNYNIPTAIGVENLVLECIDLKKNTFQQSFIKSIKQDTFSGQNFLIKDARTGEPIFNNAAYINQVVQVQSDRNKNSNNNFYLGQLTDESKLPPPPFSTSGPELPDFTKSNLEIFDVDSNGQYFFLAEKGIYFLSEDPNKKIGAFIHASDDFFPEIKSLDQLPYPLRYITTKSEFQEIKDNYYPKKKVDDFWLECGGNKDRARDLIRIYYNRVQEANYYFSSFVEGWRTDRGMIHIVFGNPTRIVKQQSYETWIYGEEGQATTLTFVFRKLDSNFSQNVYVLNRDPAFKQYWEKQVTSWRNGRIYNE